MNGDRAALCCFNTQCTNHMRDHVAFLTLCADCRQKNYVNHELTGFREDKFDYSAGFRPYAVNDLPSKLICGQSRRLRHYSRVEHR
jgi:hypothetical protein